MFLKWLKKGFLCLSIFVVGVCAVMGYVFWGGLGAAKDLPQVGGGFSYEPSPGCVFQGSYFQGSDSRGAEISQVTMGDVRGGIRVVGTDGKTLRPENNCSVMPRNITECHVSQNAIFGKVDVPKDRSATDYLSYDGWFFFDIPGKICYHLLTEEEYNEILDKYEIAAAERVLSPPLTQDRNKWPKFPVSPK